MSDHDIDIDESKKVHREPGTGCVNMHQGRWEAIAPKVGGNRGPYIGRFHTREQAIVALDNYLTFSPEQKLKFLQSKRKLRKRGTGTIAYNRAKDTWETRGPQRQGEQSYIGSFSSKEEAEKALKDYLDVYKKQRLAMGINDDKPKRKRRAKKKKKAGAKGKKAAGKRSGKKAAGAAKGKKRKSASASAGGEFFEMCEDALGGSAKRRKSGAGRSRKTPTKRKRGTGSIRMHRGKWKATAPQTNHGHGKHIGTFDSKAEATMALDHYLATGESPANMVEGSKLSKALKGRTPRRARGTGIITLRKDTNKWCAKAPRSRGYGGQSLGSFDSRDEAEKALDGFLATQTDGDWLGI